MLENSGQAYYVLAVNSGSSSLKVGLYDCAENPKLLQSYHANLIGQPGAVLNITFDQTTTSQDLPAKTHSEALRQIICSISKNYRLVNVKAVGYRLVHGGTKYLKPVLVTPQVTAELASITDLAPEHLPKELEVVRHLSAMLTSAQHIACFDTEFFSSLPLVAKTLPLASADVPIEIQKYGFHGLSYEYILSYLTKNHPEIANKKIIVAHLGSGASLAGLNEGKPIDTTMSFSPASGIMMSTRSGDLDPGVITYLQTKLSLSPHAISEMVNKRSGLLGISGKSADMEAIIQDPDPKSQLAYEMFCYQVKKTIGAMAAAMNGLDVIVFSAGIGQNSAVVRLKVCQELDFLGIKMDNSANSTNQEVVSTADSRVKILVVKTDEQEVIVNKTLAAIGGKL